MIHSIHRKIRSDAYGAARPVAGAEGARDAGATDREGGAHADPAAENGLRAELHGYLPGMGCVSRLEDIVEDPHTDLTVLARRFCRELLDHIAQLTPPCA